MLNENAVRLLTAFSFLSAVHDRPRRCFTKTIHLRHDVWDFGDMSGRFLEGLILARNMFDPTKSMLQDEGRIRGFLGSHLGPDGLVMNPDKHDVDHMFAQ